MNAEMDYSKTIFSHTMIKLRPCPFCGRMPGLHVEKIANERLYWITCKCGIEQRAYKTKIHAIKKWNRRVND